MNMNRFIKNRFDFFSLCLYRTGVFGPENFVQLELEADRESVGQDAFGELAAG